MVIKVFQGANVCQPSDKLNFSGGTISVVANDATASGWTVKNSDKHQTVSWNLYILQILSWNLYILHIFIDDSCMQVTEMERYNGDGEPPYCELILKAVSDGSTTPHFLSTSME